MRASPTHAKTDGWGRRYTAALGRYLTHGPTASLAPAAGLGRQAVALGLETLDVAKIHKKALAAVASPAASKAGTGAIRQARLFFAEAIHPIEQTHDAARQFDRHIHQLNRTLHRRSEETSAVSLRLKQTILRRRDAEAALAKSGKEHALLLDKAHRLQTHLRRLTREFLSKHENERRKMSRHLHDEIAQTLLGIHVRLLALKTGAKAHAKNLKKEIANTQRLVKESVKLIDRAADKYGNLHER